MLIALILLVPIDAIIGYRDFYSEICKEDSLDHEEAVYESEVDLLRRVGVS